MSDTTVKPAARRLIALLRREAEAAFWDWAHRNGGAIFAALVIFG